ncbi:MAG: Hsp20/alpha crystallin family protein [Fimbriimonadaceae bacterium]
MGHRDEDEWLDQISKEMGRLAGEMTGAGLKPARSKGWSPRVDVLETQNYVVVKVELAGVRSEKVAIHYSATKNTLTLRGWRYDEIIFPDERQVAHQLEIDYGEFWREVPLPEAPVDVEHVKASFRAGMLLLALPKCEGKPKTVTVKKVITIQRL